MQKNRKEKKNIEKENAKLKMHLEKKKKINKELGLSIGNYKRKVFV